MGCGDYANKKVEKAVAMKQDVAGKGLYKAVCPFCGKVHNKLTLKRCEHYSKRVDYMMYFQSSELKRA